MLPVYPNTAMSADTCLAIAQILPVLLVVLIAEQVTVRVRADGRPLPREALAALARVSVDLVLAGVLVIDLFTVLRGIEAKGLEDEQAALAWNLTTFMIVAVVYRWFLLTPVVRMAIARGFALYARAGTYIVHALADTMTRMPIGIANAVNRFATLLVASIELLAHVLTGGIETFSDGISRLVSRRRKEDDDPDS